MRGIHWKCLVVFSAILAAAALILCGWLLRGQINVGEAIKLLHEMMEGL